MFWCEKKKNALRQRDVLNGQITLTKFALWASEVISDSEVHLVSEVSPDGEVRGKLNFTWCIKVAKQLCTNFTATQLHFRVSEKFTGRKRDNITAINRFVISFCRYKGLGLAHSAFVRTNQSACAIQSRTRAFSNLS